MSDVLSLTPLSAYMIRTTISHWRTTKRNLEENTRSVLMITMANKSELAWTTGEFRSSTPSGSSRLGLPPRNRRKSELPVLLGTARCFLSLSTLHPFVRRINAISHCLRTLKNIITFTFNSLIMKMEDCDIY